MVGVIFINRLQKKIPDRSGAVPLHFSGEATGGLGADMQIGKKQNAPAVQSIRPLLKPMAIKNDPERPRLLCPDLTGLEAVDPVPVADRALERYPVHSSGDNSLASAALSGAIDLTVALEPSGRVTELPAFTPSRVSPNFVL